ncbi:McrB family protein [Shewanella sp. YLB-07]|uniref:McrB family protein n=1 Tax=Shewanella sp. YLB-07 TaxID=2601268 RepID=UPI001D153393|nr:AAA family ATPase [Shewanella sp. YLB-07]
MESEVRTISDAIVQLNKDGYYEKDFKHFVEIEGELYPAKTLYSLIHNVHHKECHTSDAAKYFRKEGYKLVNKDPLSRLPTIWKVSHGTGEISDDYSRWLDENHYITVHRDTAKSQGEIFSDKVQVGDIVSLYRSGYVKALVRVTNHIVPDDSSPLGLEWQLRKYEVINELPKLKKYTGVKKGWSPSYNNTIGELYQEKTELALFEGNILQPYYGMSLDDLFARSGPSIKGNSMGNLVSHQNITSPLNQILYGPPGTGKTYHTIEAAVKAAEPDEYADLGIEPKLGANEEQRRLLTEMYRTLSDAGRIRFVTFHQSYGYEEFVEGLKANSEDGEISYDVEKGIFRQICDEAAKHTTEKAASKVHNFELCWQAFVEQLAEQDSLEITMSQTSFHVVDFNAKRIFFEKSNGKKDHTLSIKTLKDIFEGSREYTSGLGVYYNPLVRYLKGLVATEQQPATKRQNYVLIIDEINRGNISKIFGELITLIEPSKRKGADEELELQLSLSRPDDKLSAPDKFSVPDNLYLIGTMNTADRSLAMMDTALRRRFDFVEMMPRADLFSVYHIKWQEQQINLQSLLESLNKRIEVLYDREHTLGHAFLFPAYNAAKAGKHELAFTHLKQAFKNKIIPLLEEYFYEDWNKIRLVLGDSLKIGDNESLRLLEVQKESYTELFGGEHGLELYEDCKTTYQMKPFDCKDSIWDKVEAYIGIYSAKSVKGEVVEG